MLNVPKQRLFKTQEITVFTKNGFNKIIVRSKLREILEDTIKKYL